MDWSMRRKPFTRAVRAAFPADCESIADKAEDDLRLFVDDAYRTTSRRLIVDGSNIYIPYRLHFADGIAMRISGLSPGAHCLLTRATNGYLRQKAARAVIGLNQAWAIPFVALLLGEYVLEIAVDIHSTLDQLDRLLYREFVLQNRDTMRILRAKATSYWDAYHRQSHPDRRSYPALAAITRLEEWAS